MHQHTYPRDCKYPPEPVGVCIKPPEDMSWAWVCCGPKVWWTCGEAYWLVWEGRQLWTYWADAAFWWWVGLCEVPGHPGVVFTRVRRPGLILDPPGDTWACFGVKRKSYSWIIKKQGQGSKCNSILSKIIKSSRTRTLWSKYTHKYLLTLVSPLYLHVESSSGL